MKILVLSTGGTIGSATKDGVMSPDKNATALSPRFRTWRNLTVRAFRIFFPKMSPSLFTKSL